MHHPTDRSALLRNCLRANAAFSAVSGALFTIASPSVAQFLGVEPSAIVTAVGLNLLGFAAILLYVATRETLARPLVKLIIGLDLGWVLGTAAVLYAGLFTHDGSIAAALVADVVLAFAVVQWLGLRRITPRADVPQSA